MNTKKTVTIGMISGLWMGVALFIAGALFSRIIYGPQFAPPGKFKPEQMNPFYFIWTKAVIGIIFGILFTIFYEKLPLSKRLSGPLQGVKYSFLFWLLINAWAISHPLVYGSIWNKDQLFWLVYTLIGFLVYGLTLGRFYKKNQSLSPI
jgi:hypothetical protein